MTTETSKVQAVFGQFAVEIDGVVEMFATEAEAQTASDAFENSNEYLALAKAYTDSKGYEDGGKNAKAKANIIVDFLAFQSSHVATAAVVNGDAAPASF